MKKYEKFAKDWSEENCRPEDYINFSDRSIELSYKDGFLKMREMVLKELKNHPDSDSVPSWIFVCLEELGEEEV